MLCLFAAFATEGEYEVSGRLQEEGTGVLHRPDAVTILSTKEALIGTG